MCEFGRISAGDMVLHLLQMPPGSSDVVHADFEDGSNGVGDVCGHVSGEDFV